MHLIMEEFIFFNGDFDYESYLILNGCTSIQ